MDDTYVDLDFDTDEISFTSTRDSDNDGVYDIKCILSEGIADDERGNRVNKYLIEWEGYRKDECEKFLTHIVNHFMLCVLTETGTWEPEEGLKDTGLLEPWKRAKDRMGPDAFAKFKEAQEVEFYRAHRRHHMGKPIRKEKRARKRDMMKRHKRSTPLIDVSDSEDDTPLAQMRPARSSKGQKPELAAPASQSSYYDNFVDSQDPDPLPPPPAYQPSEKGLFVAESNRMRRKAPLTQSEDEESSSVNSDSADSLMGELADSAKSDPHKRKSKASPGPDLGHSVLSPKRPRKKASAPSEKPVSKQPVANVLRHEEPPIPSRKLTAPVAAMVPKVTQLKKPTAQSGAPAVQTSSPVLRRKSIGSVNMSESSTTAAARTTTKVTNAAKPTIAGVPSRSTGPTAIRRTGGSSKSSNPAIKFTNGPRTQQRKPWQHSEDRQYNKLHFRAVAQKRSQTESAPNVADLDFVGPAPAGLARPRATDDNPYGRRETGSRRVQESDSYEPRRRESIEDIAPFEDHEANKAPLVCPHWRLGNNCPYGPIKCNFLHRNKDENGKDIPVGDMSGVMPPKYRKPALTCLYWLNSERGCRKPDVECIYAHKNTGWVPKDMNNNQAVQIDPSALPVSALSTRTPSIRTLSINTSMPQNPTITPQDKRKMRPSELTCWYWTQNKCKNSDERCTFRHYDTGVVADPPPGTLTCRYWVENRCKLRADQCKFQHFNTGIIAGQTSAVFGGPPAFPNNGTHQDYSTLSPTIDLLSAWTEPQAPAEQLYVPPPPPSAPHVPAPAPPARYSCLELKDQVERALQLNFVDLFEWDQTTAGRTMVNRRAMLLFHPLDHAEELEVITRWLLMHHVEVSSAWHEGAWDYFRQQTSENRSGVILTHPDFEFYTELSGFGRLLRKQIRLWSLGVQEGIEYDPALSSTAKMRHDCIEIFPVGGLIYVTEDVFEQKPQLALQIMKHFFAKIDELRQLEGPVSPWQEVDDAPLLWRLCVRPELMEYLYERCEEQSSELDAGDPDATARATLYTLLCETNYIEQDHPILPLNAISDKYPVMSERRIIAEEQPLDYFAIAARDPKEATRRMIRYYAGLQVDMRRDYRHFYVVHTEPFATCVRTWRQDVQTIADVIDPERCVAELSKIAVKGNEKPLFDFHERHMPALNSLSITDTTVGQVAQVQSEQVTSVTNDGQADVNGGRRGSTMH